MRTLTEQRFIGERALFGSEDLEITYSIFADGESPLKESRNIHAAGCSFQWKYPFWYCENIETENCTFAEMARAGIWYGKQIAIRDALYEAPKGLRRIEGLTVERTAFPHAEETLWHCKDVTMKQITAKGDYFGMNCENVEICDFQIAGNYCFDGCKHVTVRNARMLSKDAFWNCEDVTVYDSFISGEYLGWNSKNITFVNCTIESLQGLCYIENLVLKNCRLINTTLAFEYSTVDAEVTTKIDSVINPKSGRIAAKAIEELILDETKVDPAKTEIIVGVNS